MIIISSTVGKNPLEEKKYVTLIVNRRVQNAVLGVNLKNDRTMSVRFQDKPFNITVIQVYAPTTDTKEAEVGQFCEDLQDLLQLTTNKRYLFRWEGGSCLGTHVRIKDFKIKKK